METDHDILIELRGEVKALRSDVTSMKDNTKETLSDHESRIRRMELWGAMGLGGAYVLDLTLRFLLK